MYASSNATRVKPDPNLLLGTLDVEGSDEVNSDISKWWLFPLL